MLMSPHTVPKLGRPAFSHAFLAAMASCKASAEEESAATEEAAGTARAAAEGESAATAEAARATGPRKRPLSHNKPLERPKWPARWLCAWPCPAALCRGCFSNMDLEPVTCVAWRLSAPPWAAFAYMLLRWKLMLTRLWCPNGAFSNKISAACHQTLRAPPWPMVYTSLGVREQCAGPAARPTCDCPSGASSAYAPPGWRACGRILPAPWA